MAEDPTIPSGGASGGDPQAEGPSDSSTAKASEKDAGKGGKTHFLSFLNPMRAVRNIAEGPAGAVRWIGKTAYDGLALMPKATLDGIRVANAAYALESRFERTAYYWEAVIFLLFFVASMVWWGLWWSLKVNIVGALGPIAVGMLWFTRKNHNIVRKWVRQHLETQVAPGDERAIKASLATREEMKELTVARIQRIDGMIQAWKGLDREQRHDTSFEVARRIGEEILTIAEAQAEVADAEAVAAASAASQAEAGTPEAPPPTEDTPT